MQELSAHLMVTAVIGIIAYLAIEFLNFLLRRRAMKAGHLDEHYVRLLTNKPNKFSALKWGIIFLFAGLGLVVIAFLPYSAEKSPIPWGVEIIFIGLGFLVYYLILTKKKRE